MPSPRVCPQGECAKAADKPALLASANLIAEDKSDAFSCKTSYDCYKNDLLACVTTAVSDITCGVDCSYCVTKGSLTKYAAAAQFVQPDFTAMTKYEAKGGKGTLSCSYFHKVSGDMQVGVAVAKPLAKPDMNIEFGCAYKLDKDTSVKAKVDSEGVMCTSYKLKVSPITTMTLADRHRQPRRQQAQVRPAAQHHALSTQRLKMALVVWSEWREVAAARREVATRRSKCWNVWAESGPRRGWPRRGRASMRRSAAQVAQLIGWSPVCDVDKDMQHD